MSAAAGSAQRAVAPPAATDALAARLGALRHGRRDAGWPAALLALARELTMAEAAVLLAPAPEGGWRCLGADPEPQGAPQAEPRRPGDPWAGAADAALAAGGVAALRGAAAGIWFLAVPVGHVGPIGAAPQPGVVAVRVAPAHSLDLALTRERLAFVGALAEGATVAGAAEHNRRGALAAAAAEALLRNGDPAEGAHAAAVLLASAVPETTRVSLALFRRGRLRALALSDQQRAEPGAELPRRLLGVMEEAAMAGEPLAFAPGAAAGAALRAFADAFGPRPLLALAARDGGGALVIELSRPAPAGLAAELAPALSLLSLAAGARRARMPRLPAGARRLALAAAAGVALLGFVPRAAVVEAPFSLQPERQQVVSAPFDGIVEASAVQPGDSVAAGATVLARLATRDFEMELSAARARAENDRREAGIARAGDQPAQEQLALLAARRDDAQVALLRSRIAQAEMRAPVDGIVVSGDLRRSLGQPVARGQPLFEIAPAGALRAEILVLDERLPQVQPGQKVRLAPAAEPGRVREAVVERIRPMAEIVQGRNIFRVIARFEGEAMPRELRPGTEGLARIETGRTTWLLALLDEPVRLVRRWLWI